MSVGEVVVYSPITYETRYGTYAMYYGRNLTHGHRVSTSGAVSVITVQSIGEPGT